MESLYKINEELDIPIYKQLVDAILAAIKSGILKAGEKLPTVNEMTTKLGIARGTVKRAYDELEHSGFVEKVQGSGTFVKYIPSNSESRKEQAMAAIDDMLNKLETIGFSTAEINIYLNLKLREYSQEAVCVKVAVIECNSENLSQMCEQFRHIDGVDLYSYTVDSIKQYPYKLGEDFDLIVTTASHFQYLESVVPDKKKIVRVALRPSDRWLLPVIKLRKGSRIGIVGYSKRFAELIYESCETYAEDVFVEKPFFPTKQTNAEQYLKGKDYILIPKNYEKYFDSDTINAISKFKGNVIECNYEMDEGSVLYLETKVKKIQEEKRIN